MLNLNLPNRVVGVDKLFETSFCLDRVFDTTEETLSAAALFVVWRVEKSRERDEPEKERGSR